VSVINKMLRDLDRRNAPESAAAARPGLSLRHGTVSLPELARQSARRSWWWWVLGALMGVALVAVASWWGVRMPVPAVAVAPSAVPVALTPAASQASAAAPVASVATSAVASAMASVPLAKASAAAWHAAVSAPVGGASAVRPVASVAQQQVTARAGVVASGARSSAPAVAALLPVASGGHATVPAQPASTSASTVRPMTLGTGNAAADPNAGSQRQQQAWRDALAQAQALWNAGSHDAATDLLQQAVAVAEQVTVANPKQPPTLMLITLVREYVRMLMADGRVSPAFDLLVRLEGPLGRDPDIWAMRANAAQRLGRHAECVVAYTVALQSRPREQRWILGAAVSLAAMGDMAQATEMAERARAVGPISPEVLTYLRQAGVQLREP